MNPFTETRKSGPELYGLPQRRASRMIMRELSKNEEEVRGRFDDVADAPAKILGKYSEILRNGWREKRGRGGGIGNEGGQGPGRYRSAR